MIGILITTYNRPSVLARSLPQIASFGRRVLVVDDGSPQVDQYRDLCRSYGAEYLRLPTNRGLAAALNAGLSYWLADKTIKWISYFQDDTDVHPRLMDAMEDVTRKVRGSLFTGHDSQYHNVVKNVNGFRLKKSCAGLHMHGRVEFWASIMPIPTYQLGCPKRVDGRERGYGSNADWWIVRDAPNSIAKRREFIVCVPGLVRTFLYRAEDSSWGNGLKLGEEPPLRVR